MEPVNRTNQDLWELVDDLDAKIGPSSPSGSKTLALGERVIDLTGEEPKVRRRFPAWLGFAAVILLFIGLATVAVRPWDQCGYSSEVCRIAQLDIDALRVALPNSDLIAQLPNIDALDPDDVLTVGDVFEMDRFVEWNLEDLLTDSEVDQLLATIE